MRAALRRIDEGTFGVCLHCEEDITPKRLAAVPWTAFCIQCQEIADRNQAGDGSESFDEMLAALDAGASAPLLVPAADGAGAGRRSVES